MNRLNVVFVGIVVAFAAISTHPLHAMESETMTTHFAQARHHFVMPKNVDVVFALFDPIAEIDWVPGWNPQPVHPPEMSLEEGSVFLLDRGERKEIWTILRHDPEAHIAEYLATSAGYQQRWITVKCETVETGTRVDVQYRVTALSPEGQADLVEFNEDFIKAWEEPVAKALGL